ncbi:MAG TPA: glycosyl hydrolase family 28-related protein [Verrucomicrobiae bacterium]|nr:glycosyl hydrolase family 28-related protein [Verrucomicrobiae bacterium]
MSVFTKASLLLMCVAALAVAAGSQPDFHSVLDFGAKADGKTDDTAAFQKALDSAGQSEGGIVYAPRGNYFFAGHLDVPVGVTLEGVWQSVPSHTGLRDKTGPKPTDNGTTFLVTENAGDEDAAPFIKLNTDSTLKGVVIFYPNQIRDAVPRPYPYAIVMRGDNAAVLQVELLNPYNGIDASQCARHLIRDVQGQPLHRGIFVDAIYDVGRIEDVHFNPWWSMEPKLFQWQQANGEAFVFGRADWEYVFNTFCFGYHTGYQFIKTKSGVCNGNFLGIGADDCFSAVDIEDCAVFGLLISNGEFTSFHGPDPTMVRVETNNTGVVRFVNCAFWGPCNQIAKIAGRGTAGFSDCTFVQWDRNKEGRSAIQADSGTLLVNGCEFREDKPQVELGERVQHAVISQNIFAGAARVTNHSRHSVVVSDNSSN